MSPPLLYIVYLLAVFVSARFSSCSTCTRRNCTLRPPAACATANRSQTERRTVRRRLRSTFRAKSRSKISRSIELFSLYTLTMFMSIIRIESVLISTYETTGCQGDPGGFHRLSLRARVPSLPLLFRPLRRLGDRRRAECRRNRRLTGRRRWQIDLSLDARRAATGYDRAVRLILTRFYRGFVSATMPYCRGVVSRCPD